MSLKVSTFETPTGDTSNQAFLTDNSEVGTHFCQGLPHLIVVNSSMSVKNYQNGEWMFFVQKYGVFG